MHCPTQWQRDRWDANPGHKIYDDDTNRHSLQICEHACRQAPVTDCQPLPLACLLNPLHDIRQICITANNTLNGLDLVNGQPLPTDNSRTATHTTGRSRLSCFQMCPGGTRASQTLSQLADYFWTLVLPEIVWEYQVQESGNSLQAGAVFVMLMPIFLLLSTISLLVYDSFCTTSRSLSYISIHTYLSQARTAAGGVLQAM